MSFRNTLKHLVHTSAKPPISTATATATFSSQTHIPSPSTATFSGETHLPPPPTSTFFGQTHLPPPPTAKFFGQTQMPQQTFPDPYNLMKQDPVEILSDLWVKTFSKPQHIYRDLTGFLSKFDLWVLAYQRTCAHATGTFPPRNAIHSHALYRLLDLQEAVLSDNFSWDSRTEQIIQAPGEQSHLLMSRKKMEEFLKSKETLFQDRIVQEVLLMIVEPVFEPRFSTKSHAFRPNRNPHTVIRTLRSNFAGYEWFIRGDLTDVLYDFDGGLAMGLVEKVVKDRKVLKLIKAGLKDLSERNVWRRRREEEEKAKPEKLKKQQKTIKRLLKANERKPDPYWLRTFDGFAPEEADKVPNYGHIGILSPLLTNIYLNELDYLMEKKIVEFFRPCELDSIWKFSINDGCHNPLWPEFVPASGKGKTMKMDYIRHGGYFLIGIRGPRDEAVRIRKEIMEFCDVKYGVRVDTDRIKIGHISRGVEFLDHVIGHRVIYPTLRYTGSGGNIVSEKGVGTLLSITASLHQCMRRFRKLKYVKGDKDPEPLACTSMLYSGQAHTNSQMNKLLETLADWYRYADNRKTVVGFCAYIIRSSVAKLYAARYRLKSRAKVYGIASRNLSRPLKDHSNHSLIEYSDLYRMGLVDKIEGIQFTKMSLVPTCDYTPFPTDWIPHHERVLQEYIKLQDPKYFCELLKSLKRHGLRSPQDEVTELVWNFKTLGVQSCQPAELKDEEKASQG